MTNSSKKILRKSDKSALDHLSQWHDNTRYYKNKLISAAAYLNQGGRVSRAQSRGQSRGNSRQTRHGSPSRAQRYYDVGEGMKQCPECMSVFHYSESHSCVYYLQRLIRTIVGDTAYERAHHILDSNINLNSKDAQIELGTMEELMQDYQKSYTMKLER